MIKGYTKEKTVHQLVKKGYTKAHIANSKKIKFKGANAPQQIGQQDNDNNAESMRN